MSSLTEALLAGKQLSKKAKMSHLNKDAYLEPLRGKIHILKLGWAGAAKLG